MHGGDRGLDLVGAGGIAAQQGAHDLVTLVDQAAVPPGAVLVAEHLGVSREAFEQELAEQDSFVATVDALRGAGRSLRKFTEFMVEADVSPLAENELMDPDHVPPSLAESAWKLVTGVTARVLGKWIPAAVTHGIRAG